MIIAWILAAMLALGSSEDRIMGNLTAYCSDMQNCTRGESYGGYGYYTSTASYAVNGQCYRNANISLYDLSIIPNDSVLVSCILASNGNVSYTVMYSLAEDRIRIDRWSNGKQSTRIIQVSIAR